MITDEVDSNSIFCFSSNLQGRHGKGAALHAYTNFGAEYGVGEGLQGRSYAIPTKDKFIKTLPIYEIYRHVKTFINFAKDHPEYTFHLTPIGCGLAGYKYEEIAPLFTFAPENVILPDEFIGALKENMNIDEENDFGFSLVSEDDVKKKEVILKKQVEHHANNTKKVVFKTSEILEKMRGLIMPLLLNLAKEKDKSYIYWPNRTEKIEAFIDKMNSFIEENSVLGDSTEEVLDFNIND
jgi:hypothetical protein